MIAAADVILNFHGLGTPARDLEPGEARYWIDETFFRHILALVADRYPATHITFDDGNLSDVAIGLPALRERGMTARFFVLASRIGRPGSLGPGDLHRLEQAGMRIGVHGSDHVDWRHLDAAGRAREMVGARQSIARHCRGPLDEAAVPFGCYNAGVLQALREAGYKAVFTSDGGTAGQGPVFARSSVRNDMTIEAVETILADAEGTFRKLRRRAAVARKRLF